MPCKLTKLTGTSESEFDDLVRVEFISYENPPCKLKELFFPINGAGDEAREAAVKDAVKRQLLWHQCDPTSIWITVIDEDSNQLVGAACWHIYESDPYAVNSDEECDWFAEGEDRKAANALMEQWLTPRMTYMRKPHAFLDICYTHPEFRRRGVGKLSMDWGINEADKRNLETYIDATEAGRLFYKGNGFIEGTPREFTLQDLTATPRRKELEEKLLPFRWWPMHRPAGGKYETGKGLLPWEKMD